MNVYISSHDEVAATELAEALTRHGHKVASRWVTSKENIHDATDELRTARVMANIDDIKACDVLAVLAAPKGEMVPGGKHFEAGYAVAIGKPVYVVGRRENLYHRHPSVFVVDDADELLDKLSG